MPRRAGIFASCHKLCHTFASNLLEQGAEIVAILELLGHASLAANERYGKVSNQQVKDERSLVESCCLKACNPQWDLGHPPQTTERAVRVHILFTRLMFALATAYRLQCEHEATAGEPVGWQRWRRQLLE